MGTTAEVLEKLRGLDAPKMLAIVDLFGSRENLEACLCGKKKIVLEDVTRNLVDVFGRGIAAHLGISSKVFNENKQYHVEQPQWNYGEVLALFNDAFPKGTRFLDLAEFEDRAQAALMKLMKDPLTQNVINRVHMPLPFPQYEVSDYGRCLKDFFLPAVNYVNKKRYPDWEFVNYHVEEMDGYGSVSIIPDTGHDQFIARMAEGPGMAWYFPCTMQGFSVLAQREAMKSLLPRGFFLSGAIEPALGFVGYSAEMARDEKTPGYNCPAISFLSSAASLYFKADEFCMELGIFYSLEHAYDYYSGGLIYLG